MYLNLTIVTGKRIFPFLQIFKRYTIIYEFLHKKTSPPKKRGPVIQPLKKINLGRRRLSMQI